MRQLKKDPKRLEEYKKKYGFEPFFPNDVIRKLIIFYAILGILVVAAVYIPMPVEPPADPFNTPAHIKPEWYFLGVYQFLKLIPNETLGIFLQMIGVLILIFLPFLDRGPRKPLRERPILTVVAILVALGYIILSIWGKYS